MANNNSNQIKQSSGFDRAKSFNKRKVKCSNCDKSVISMSSHIFRVHNHLLPLACNQCGKKFAREQSLKQHAKNHMLDPQPCKQCNKMYPGKLLLKNHIHQCKHKLQKLPNKTNILDKRYNTKFSTDSNLKNCMVNDLPFKCNMCDLKFKNQYSLNRHTTTAHINYNQIIKSTNDEEMPQVINGSFGCGTNELQTNITKNDLSSDIQKIFAMPHSNEIKIPFSINANSNTINNENVNHVIMRKSYEKMPQVISSSSSNNTNIIQTTIQQDKCAVSSSNDPEILISINEDSSIVNCKYYDHMIDGDIPRIICSSSGNEAYRIQTEIQHDNLSSNVENKFAVSCSDEKKIKIGKNAGSTIINHKNYNRTSQSMSNISTFKCNICSSRYRSQHSLDKHVSKKHKDYNHTIMSTDNVDMPQIINVSSYLTNDVQKNIQQKYISSNIENKIAVPCSNETKTPIKLNADCITKNHKNYSHTIKSMNDEVMPQVINNFSDCKINEVQKETQQNNIDNRLPVSYSNEAKIPISIIAGSAPINNKNYNNTSKSIDNVYNPTFKCDICSSQYKTQSSLKRHATNKHKKNNHTIKCTDDGNVPQITNEVCIKTQQNNLSSNIENKFAVPSSNDIKTLPSINEDSPTINLTNYNCIPMSMNYGEMLQDINGSSANVTYIIQTEIEHATLSSNVENKFAVSCSNEKKIKIGKNEGSTTMNHKSYDRIIKSTTNGNVPQIINGSFGCETNEVCIKNRQKNLSSNIENKFSVSFSNETKTPIKLNEDYITKHHKNYSHTIKSMNDKIMPQVIKSFSGCETNEVQKETQHNNIDNRFPISYSNEAKIPISIIPGFASINHTNYNNTSKSIDNVYNPTFKCDMCSSQYKTQSSLKRHATKKHKKNNHTIKCTDNGNVPQITNEVCIKTQQNNLSSNIENKFAVPSSNDIKTLPSINEDSPTINLTNYNCIPMSMNYGEMLQDINGSSANVTYIIQSEIEHDNLSSNIENKFEVSCSNDTKTLIGINEDSTIDHTNYNSIPMSMNHGEMLNDIYGSSGNETCRIQTEIQDDNLSSNIENKFAMPCSNDTKTLIGINEDSTIHHTNYNSIPMSMNHGEMLKDIYGFSGNETCRIQTEIQDDNLSSNIENKFEVPCSNDTKTLISINEDSTIDHTNYNSIPMSMNHGEMLNDIYGSSGNETCRIQTEIQDDNLSSNIENKFEVPCSNDTKTLISINEDSTIDHTNYNSIPMSMNHGEMLNDIYGSSGNETCRIQTEIQDDNLSSNIENKFAMPCSNDTKTLIGINEDSTIHHTNYNSIPMSMNHGEMLKDIYGSSGNETCRIQTEIQDDNLSSNIENKFAMPCSNDTKTLIGINENSTIHHTNYNSIPMSMIHGEMLKDIYGSSSNETCRIQTEIQDDNLSSNIENKFEVPYSNSVKTPISLNENCNTKNHKNYSHTIKSTDDDGYMSQVINSFNGCETNEVQTKTQENNIENKFPVFYSNEAKIPISIIAGCTTINHTNYNNTSKSTDKVNNPTFKCDICSSQYKTQSSLKRHATKHKKNNHTIKCTDNGNVPQITNEVCIKTQQNNLSSNIENNFAVPSSNDIKTLPSINEDSPTINLTNYNCIPMSMNYGEMLQDINGSSANVTYIIQSEIEHDNLSSNNENKFAMPCSNDTKTLISINEDSTIDHTNYNSIPMSMNHGEMLKDIYGSSGNETCRIQTEIQDDNLSSNIENKFEVPCSNDTKTLIGINEDSTIHHINYNNIPMSINHGEKLQDIYGSSGNETYKIQTEIEHDNLSSNIENKVAVPSSNDKKIQIGINAGSATIIHKNYNRASQSINNVNNFTFICNICSSQYRSNYSLKRHVSKNHKDYNHIVMSTDNVDMLQINNGSFGCETNDVRIKIRENNLSSNIENKFALPCSKNTKTLISNCEDSTTINHKKYSCTSKSMNNVYNSSFKCDMCSSQYKTQRSLNRHATIKHKNSNHTIKFMDDGEVPQVNNVSSGFETNDVCMVTRQNNLPSNIQTSFAVSCSNESTIPLSIYEDSTTIHHTNINCIPISMNHGDVPQDIYGASGNETCRIQTEIQDDNLSFNIIKNKFAVSCSNAVETPISLNEDCNTKNHKNYSRTINSTDIGYMSQVINSSSGCETNELQTKTQTNNFENKFVVSCSNEVEIPTSINEDGDRDNRRVKLKNIPYKSTVLNETEKLATVQAKTCKTDFARGVSFVYAYDKPPSSSVFPFECDLCGVIQTSYLSGLKHANLHCLYKSYMCKQCDKKFYKLSLLAEHKKQNHPNMNRFQCGDCDERYKTKRSLQEHIHLSHM